MKALEKLPKEKRSFLSRFEHIDDYLFGSIAPDVRYISNVNAGETHAPKGKSSAFKAFESSSPFVAGYEAHLITDKNWGRIVDSFKVDVKKPEQKFALYFAVDRYFRSKSEWFLPVMFCGNASRADDAALLESLGFDKAQISAYKLLVCGYLLASDAQTSFLTFLTRFPFNASEKAAISVLDSLVIPERKLNSFFSASVSASAEEIAKNL
ncbi:hypothetical protein JW707_01120 [Candidatus Woesearchaeota archaeon]|nr:hypothetical protein [Candidatus Woesearchaeota archaeon]